MKSVRRSLAMSGMFVVCLHLSVFASDSLTLSNAIRSAVGANGKYVSARQMSRSSLAKAKSVGAWDDPMFMLGVNNIPTNFDWRMDPMTMTMFGISQTIPLAGQKGLFAKAAKHEAKAAVMMADKAVLEIASDVSRAFSELVIRQQILAEMRKQREIYSELTQTATDRFRIGLGGQEDVTAAQAAASRFQSQLRSTEQDCVEAASRLSALTGLQVDETSVLAAPNLISIPDRDTVWVAQALAFAPDLKQIEAQESAYEFSARAASRMRWPMLSLNASYGVRRDGPDAMGVFEPRDDMISFGAGVSIPIFAGKREGNMAHSMRYMAAGAHAERQQMEREIISMVHTLHARALSLNRSIDSYQNDVIPASEQSYQGALASYRAGRMNLGSLLSFALAPMSDRVTLLQLKLELANTLAQAQMYIIDPATLTSLVAKE